MITPGLCLVAKRDFLMGVHTPQDEYRVALYGVMAELNVSTERYTPAGEVFGPGYVAGGEILRGYRCALVGPAGVMGWTEPVIWDNASFLASGALIYNATKGRRAIAVVGLGDNVLHPVEGKLRLLPAPFTADAAPIRMW